MSGTIILSWHSNRTWKVCFQSLVLKKISLTLRKKYVWRSVTVQLRPRADPQVVVCIALMNLITGIIVEGALANAEEDKEVRNFEGFS